MKHLISHMMFENFDVSPEQFRLAIINNHLFTLEELYNKGADINYRYALNYTPLIIASSYNHLKIVKKLIEWGADMKLTNFQNKDFIDAAHIVDVKVWLETTEAQRLILSKDPSMISSLIRNKIIKPSIAKKYDYLINGSDLNLI
jgi:ankyrin repeat protein